MRVFLDQSQIENVNFYEHHYQINSYTVSREERLLMRSTNLKNEGITKLPGSGYADDLILFTQSQTDLQKATNLLDQIFERFGHEINELKTLTMVLKNENHEYPE